MSLIDIYADSRGFGTCRSCGAKIEWARRVNGNKAMPWNGEIVAIRTKREEATNRVIETLDSSVTISHFATCPDAEKFRRRR